MLVFGNGRSYGDVCLNDGGTLLATRGLDRFISFDTASGVLECEAGVLLSEIIDLTLPRGWFPPVTPGTALVTVGGAIANDVHGKNHHRAGSFGHHLLGFELRRSNGETLRCAPDQNPDWFAATIGGLGLTGMISTARLQLRACPGHGSAATASASAACRSSSRWRHDRMLTTNTPWPGSTALRPAASSDAACSCAAIMRTTTRRRRASRCCEFR